ncbi:hypothetical protein E3O44_15400 [Cryobacterium algoricola]|uniref:Uncharacterized protein n=1 Tax=Cryobacterium algoricola TaxID=1259183 RepID=A0ABY2I949_9MICO|nr:hypothetical protein [Cryobacterium algoricola]TFB84465.1 hypothetical protein E3O44_15400 [Cryobacterium algoricola]
MVVLAVGYSAMTYRSTLKTTGSPAAAWNSVLEIGVWAVAASVVVFAWVLTMRHLAELRERRLRINFPDAIVLRSRALLQLRKALRRVVDSEGHSIVGLGFGYLTLVGSADGIAIWDGWGRPYEICRWAWTDIADIVPAMFVVRSQRLGGLEVVVRQHDLSSALPFMIVGTGFKGLLPPSPEEIAKLGNSMAKLRR